MHWGKDHKVFDLGHYTVYLVREKEKKGGREGKMSQKMSPKDVKENMKLKGALQLLSYSLPKI